MNPIISEPAFAQSMPVNHSFADCPMLFKVLGRLFLRALNPFLIAVITDLPRLSQLNADHTAMNASKICGRFSRNAGIASIRPFPIVTSNFTPATSSFGALSLITPAILITICGSCASSVGSESIRPCARFKIRSIPESTIVPALDRNVSENLSSIGSACEMTCGTPATRPLEN